MERPRRDLPERTFQFARRIVMLCRTLEQAPGVSRTLANQLLRAGTSIGATVFSPFTLHSCIFNLGRSLGEVG